MTEASAGRRTTAIEWAALLGVMLLVIAVPLLPGRIEIGSLPLDAPILAIPLAIAASIPLLRAMGRGGIPGNGIEVAGTLFLCWTLLSIAAVGGGKDELLTWLRYASYIVLVPVVGAVAADAGRRRWVMWAIVIAGSITAGHGLIQYLNPTQNIGMQGLASDVATRVFATFDNPNFYAEYLVLLIAASLALVSSEKGLRRWLVACLLALQAVALMLTYTRGSWLALAIGIAVAVLVIDARYILGLVAGAAVLIPVVPGGLQRVASIFSLEGTASFRLGLWRVAGTIIRENMLFGTGLGDFYRAFQNAVLTHPELHIGYTIYGAHNSYFTLAAESGVIGGIAFLAVVLTAARLGVFYARRKGMPKAERFQIVALMAGLIAFAINALTSNSFQHPRAAVFFWVVAGVQMGIGSRFWDAPASEQAVAQARDTVFSRSMLGRAWLAVRVAAGRLWGGSEVREWLMSRPLGGGRIFAGSRFGAMLLGNGHGDVEGAA